MKIHVTQDDIDRGVKQSSVSCPVALALSRVAPKGNWSVSPLSCFNTVELVEHRLPLKVQWFISEVDMGLPVLEPFSFELEISDAILANTDTVPVPWYKRLWRSLGIRLPNWWRHSC